MLSRLSISRRAVALVVTLPLIGLSPAIAQTPAGAVVHGTISDVSSGLPVANASVTLERSGQPVANTTTDSSGRYTFPAEPPAIYTVVAAENGYGRTASLDVPLTPGSTGATVDVALARSTGGATQGLRTIGSTQTSATQGGGLQRTSTVSEDLSSTALLRQNYVNVGEAVTNLPGVNNTGHSSTIGDDTSISLRGFSPSEAQTLLDGHPIGPIGVGGGGYNFQVSPFFVLSNTQVTFGAGALGLYGTDATGGAIDLQTLNPTRDREFTLSQGFGTQGKAFSALQATGTVGKLGFAFGGATQGTYGDFAPQIITQSGNLGFDNSPGNIAANTHLVSGNYSLRDALLKLQYEILPGTTATITGYTAHSRDDKSGVGDNDFQPLSLATQAAQSLAGTGNCPANLVPVKTSDAGAITCETVAAAAAGNFGPSGGGPNPFQEIVNQDYHGRLTTNYLGNTIAIDGYVDNYNLNYNRNQNSQNANGVFTGGFNQNLYKTNGFLISDDSPRGNNDFGFGYFVQHQTFDSNNFDTANLVIVPNPTLFLATDNIFIKDTYSPKPWVTFFGNVYYKLLSTTGADTLDPRATLILRPTAHDVVRLVAGKTDGEPAANLAQTTLNNTPSNINPNSSCSSLVGLPANAPSAQTPNQIGVGNLGAKNLQQESASDYEITLGHQFAGGSQFQLGGYVQREANLIQSLNVPVPAGTVPDGLLQQIYSRIQSSCGPSYVGTLQDLSLQQAFNSSTSGLFRGIELSGRAYVNRNLFLDGTYDLQQAQIFGYSNDQLMANPRNINGGQIRGVPLNKGSLGAEYNGRRGFDARIDGYYFGVNNGYSRPGYGFANLSLDYGYGKTGSEFTFAVNNLTNSAVQNYGFFNQGVASPVNGFANATAGNNEIFGLPPRTFLFTLTQHIRE